jgi:hypothetical protein
MKLTPKFTVHRFPENSSSPILTHYREDERCGSCGQKMYQSSLGPWIHRYTGGDAILEREGEKNVEFRDHVIKDLIRNRLIVEEDKETK